jgi:hypothetical protein
MQTALAESVEGKALTAAELQVMIGRHAQEMEELRTSSETKIARLERELASAHEALSADQDVLQDKVDELEEHAREQARKLLEAYARTEQLEQELQQTRTSEVSDWVLAIAVLGCVKVCLTEIPTIIHPVALDYFLVALGSIIVGISVLCFHDMLRARAAHLRQCFLCAWMCICVLFVVKDQNEALWWTLGQTQDRCGTSYWAQ